MFTKLKVVNASLGRENKTVIPGYGIKGNWDVLPFHIIEMAEHIVCKDTVILSQHFSGYFTVVVPSTVLSHIKREKKAVFLALKSFSHFSVSWLQFQIEKATWMTHNFGMYLLGFYPCSQTISILMSGPVGFWQMIPFIFHPLVENTWGLLDR